ncbi:MAG TPA: DUF6064 family protein [Gemmatimonadaceae bacterium]|nr:DUF6064 family protein [Gemmatimonadaceae bacterium]
MQLPFTPEQFFEVFRQYNLAVWPAQWGLYAVACVALVLALRGGRLSSRVVSATLALLWLWMAMAYHIIFFTHINTAAYAFGALFALQAALFAVFGVWHERLQFRAQRNLAGVSGGLLAVFALVLYPLLGTAFGHSYPAAPTFGLPCPTTVFTFAMLLWAWPSVPRALLIIPILWAVVGTSAAALLGVPEDFGLPVAAVVAVLVLWPKAPRLVRRRDVAWPAPSVRPAVGRVRRDQSRPAEQ